VDRSLRLALAASLVAASFTLITQAGCGSGGPGTTTTSGAGNTGAVAKAAKSKSARRGSGEAAAITPHGDGFVSSIVMWPQTNGWEVCDRHRCTSVDAGAVARDAATGLLSIHRWSTSTGLNLPGSEAVKVAGTGPVTITKAPLGRKVEVSAQRHGNLRFRGKTGITGTLHLKDNSVTLDP
jgi:hypothetical protein